MKSAPDRFEQMFPGLLPPQWEQGQLIQDGLPPGVSGAVRATSRLGGPRGVHHQVRSQNAWTSGLFQIHDDSWLSVRFRVDRPGFFHALVVCRGSLLDPGPCVVLEAPHFWKNRQPGVWYTAHVPFVEFRKTKLYQDRVLDETGVATLMLFDSQEVDRGLTIEWYRVTRGPQPPTD
jgi:hypothetical protein